MQLQLPSGIDRDKGQLVESGVTVYHDNALFNLQKLQTQAKRARKMSTYTT
jgi:hypothetical protein